jgi:hypothetical protein
MSISKKKKNIKHNKITNNHLMYIIQDLIQLEDKLFNFNKRCSNCIKERCLKIESHIDSLLKCDHKNDIFLYNILKDLPNTLRKFQIKFNKCNNDKQICNLSQDIRKIRKQLIHNYYNSDKNISYNKFKNIVNHKCSRNIMPVLNPCFNIREAVKNILLLEDHLMDPDRRCRDCIMKHSLLIEGFFEEAITIDKEMKYIKLLKNIPQKMRKIQSMIIIGRNKYSDIVLELKSIRKPLMNISFNFTKECLGDKIKN